MRRITGKASVVGTPLKLDRMKALSLVPPGGAGIAAGVKTLEIRRWAPDLLPDEDLLIVENSRFLRDDGDEDPDGKAVAIVRVALVRPFRNADIAAACASFYEEGWLAWQLTDIRPIVCALPVLAARGIYELPVDLPMLSASPEPRLVQISPDDEMSRCAPVQFPSL